MNSKKTRIGTGSQYFEDKLRDVYNTMTFSDLKIICKGGQLFAHCSVLSSASPFLKELLEDKDTTGAAVLIMPEFDRSVLKNVLEIIYTGELNLDNNTNTLLITEALKVFGIDESKLNCHQIESPPSNRPKLGRPRTSSSKSKYGRKIVQSPVPVPVSSIINKPKEKPKKGSKKQVQQNSSRSSTRTSSNDEIILMNSDSNSNNDTQKSSSNPDTSDNPTTFCHDYSGIGLGSSSNVTINTEIELTSYQKNNDDLEQENYENNDNNMMIIDSIRSITPTEYQNICKGKRQLVEGDADDNDEETETEQEKIESARIASQKDHAYAVSVLRSKGPKYRKLQKAKQLDKGSFTEHSYSQFDFDRLP